MQQNVTLESRQAEMRLRHAFRGLHKSNGHVLPPRDKMAITRDALLPLPTANKWKICECGTDFYPVHRAQRLCSNCTGRRKRDRRNRPGNRHGARSCLRCCRDYIPTGRQQIARCPSCTIHMKNERLQEFKIYGMLLNGLDPERERRKRRARDARYRAAGHKHKAYQKKWSKERRRAWNRKEHEKAKARNPEKFYAKKHKYAVKSRIKRRYPMAHMKNIDALVAIRMLINNEIRTAGDPKLRNIGTLHNSKSKLGGAI